MLRDVVLLHDLADVLAVDLQERSERLRRPDRTLEVLVVEEFHEFRFVELPHELAVEDRTSRRQAAYALMERPEEELSPEERRVAGLLHYGRAKLGMFRVFGSPPPPGVAREQLHRSALAECAAVCRLLGPLASEDPHIEDVGMTFWAASSLAHYYLKGGAADEALSYAEVAVDFIQDAALRDPEEPEYQRWRASGVACLAEAQAVGLPVVAFEQGGPREFAGFPGSTVLAMPLAASDPAGALAEGPSRLPGRAR